MKLQFLGAARTVTGAFFLLETAQARFAVDCGLFQGPKSLQERNYLDFAVDPASIDFLILTHAHIDHTGLVPKLCQEGFKGPIYCTHATEELCSALLPDSAHIQEAEVERKNRKLSRSGKKPITPIYTIEDALDSLTQFHSLNTDETVSLAPGIEIRLREAGHILGAAIIEIWVSEGEDKTKLVFSGDLGNVNQPIVKDPAIIENTDYLIIESTYGDRYHQDVGDRSEVLGEIIHEAMARGGNLIIPAFAVERTQDLLYDLMKLSLDGKLDPAIEIYLDSPLAITATEIFLKHRHLFDAAAHDYLERFPDPASVMNIKYSRTQQDSMRLNEIRQGAIIISASGMCEAGRIKHHLKHNLWRSESTILFVGFQAAGTLGRRIREGEKEVTIHGEKVAVNAQIRSIDAYSAHADRNGLISWVKQFVQPPRGVFIVHGEPEAQLSLGEYLNKELDLAVFIPDYLQEFELDHAREVYPNLDYRPERAEKAAQAEQNYLETSLRLNELFRESWSRADYERIISLMQQVRNTLETGRL